MARFLFAVTLLLVIAGVGQAQAPTPSASPQTTGTGRPDATHRSAEPSSQSSEPAQKSRSIGSLRPEGTHRSAEQQSQQQSQSPEQQQKFLENLHRWQALSPEEHEILRQRQRLNEKKREESITEAYQKSGLHLNEEQRQQFRKRYLQERSKLEEQLLKETQEKRQAGNAAIIEDLKKEFASSPSGANPTTGSPATASH
jgi:hypothetical protein